MARRRKLYDEVSTSSPEYITKRQEDERRKREEEREQALLQLKRDVLQREAVKQKPSDVDTARDDTVRTDPASALKRLQRRAEAKRQARKQSPEQQRDGAW